MEKEVSKKELIALLAAESGYHKYEIEDFVNSMARVYRKLALEQRPFNFCNILTVDYREAYSNFKISSVGGIKMKIKPSKIFNERIRRVSLGKSTVERELALSNGEQPEDSAESGTSE